MGQDFRGDFLGFTFNGTHSSELGIVRINAGDRETKDLSPQIKDTTVDIPGSDGVYFVTSQYQQRQFQVAFAYDGVSEANIKQIRDLFSDKEVHSLIFDEEPYKTYSVKVTSPVKLSFICFDNLEGTARVYKGEGNVTFTAFYPFAKATYKTWTDYVIETEGTRHYDVNGVCVEEWVEASGLKSTLVDYDSFDGVEALLYNGGEMPSPISMVLYIVEDGLFPIRYTQDGDTKGIAVIDTTELTKENYYRFNSKLKLLEGGTIVSNKFVPNGLIHNGAIVAGDFFSIKPAVSTVVQKLVVTSATMVTISHIEYDYLYV